MDIFNKFKPVMLDELSPGRIVYVERRDDEKSLALVVKGSGASPVDLVLFRHPGVNNRPGLLLGEIFKSILMLEVEGAMAIVEPNLAHIDFNLGHRFPAGALVLSTSGEAVSAHVQHNATLTYSLRSGEITTPPGNSPCITRWSIGVPGHDGKLQAIHTVTASRDG